MLFDLRGKGRRRTVRVIYASLAILMGGGLVLFGVGSDVSGGLFNAFDSDGGQSVDTTFDKKVEDLEKRLETNPRNAEAWAELARARFQQSTIGDNFDANAGTYTDKGRQKLTEVKAAWNRHVALAGDKPDVDVANVMVQAFGPSGLNELDEAVSAMEIVVDGRPESAGLYSQLAQLAYLAGQTRKGDLSADKAISLADKDERPQLRQQLDSFKTQAAAQAATDTATVPAETTTTP
jgi:tetratricopeptide (TPR) repeat protein